METTTKKWEVLVDLVRQLHKNHHWNVRQFIVIFDGNSAKKKSGKRKLYDYIANSKNPTPEGAKEKVGGSDSNFYTIQKRLYVRLLEFMLLEVHVGKAQWSDHFEAEIEAKAALNQGKIAHSLGHVKLAFLLFDEVIATCKRFDLFAELQQALRYKQRQYVSSDNHIALLEGQRAIMQAIEKEKAVAHAEQTYLDYRCRIESSGNNADELSFLIEKVGELDVLRKRHDVAWVDYYYFMLRGSLCTGLDNFVQARATYKSLAALVQHTPALFYPHLQGDALLQEAHQCLYMYQFGEALDLCKLAKSKVKQGTVTELVIKEVEALAYIAMGNVQKAIAAIVYAKAGTDNEEKPIDYTRRSYILACCYFIAGRHTSCEKALWETSYLERDRDGWNIGLRILRIMNRIARHDGDGADNGIESLKKYVSRLGKSSHLRERDEAAMDVLWKLRAEGYNFKAALPACKELLAQMQLPEKGYRWEAETHEIIQFDQWFLANAANTEYALKLSAKAVNWVRKDREQVPGAISVL